MHNKRQLPELQSGNTTQLNKHVKRKQALSLHVVVFGS